MSLNGRTVRHHQCGGCFCDFWLLEGVDPAGCPCCCEKFDEQVTSSPGEEGVYEEDEEDEQA